MYIQSVLTDANAPISPPDIISIKAAYILNDSIFFCPNAQSPAARPTIPARTNIGREIPLSPNKGIRSPEYMADVKKANPVSGARKSENASHRNKEARAGIINPARVAKRAALCDSGKTANIQPHASGTATEAVSKYS